MIREELITTIQQKLVKQKEDCVARLAELENNDPFNLTVAAEIDDERTSADDEAQLNEQHERIATQMDSQKKMIVKIDLALDRIEKRTYGVCELCGKDIEESRLSAMPLAALCLTDEKTSEQRIKKRI